MKQIIIVLLLSAWAASAAPSRAGTFHPVCRSGLAVARRHTPATRSVHLIFEEGGMRFRGGGVGGTPREMRQVRDGIDAPKTRYLRLTEGGRDYARRRSKPVEAQRRVTHLSPSAIALAFQTELPKAGTASWYSNASARREGTCKVGKHGRCLMANGKELDDGAFTAANWNYGFGTQLRVSTTARPRKSVVVEITDRGPARNLRKAGRLLDLSQKAFAALAPLPQGVIQVEIEEITRARLE